MNYEYYKMLQKKELKRNIIFIGFILIFATISTYLIYNKFKDERDYKLNLPEIDATFHSGNEVEIYDYTPVRDSVGLSTKPYKITIKNNTNKGVNFSITLSDSKLKNKKYKSYERLPKSAVKVGVHEEGKETQIYNLDDIDGVLVTKKLRPKEEVNYKIRVWTTKVDLDEGNYYYTGKISVKGE